MRIGTGQAVADALHHLSPRDRTALVLRYVLDLDDATIATEIGVQQQTVRVVLFRARRELRTALNHQHNDQQEQQR
jgi:RNA polymerase sigma factor (sigma-70 family)